MTLTRHGAATVPDELKERALANTTAKNASIPRYRPSDSVMDFLKGL